MKTIWVQVEFTLLSRLRAYSQISLKYLMTALEHYYQCKVVFAPQWVTAAWKARFEKDYRTQATEAWEKALAKFEASLQSKIYKASAAE